MMNRFNESENIKCGFPFLRIIDKLFAVADWSRKYSKSNLEI
jgi:hypothetical protein